MRFEANDLSFRQGIETLLRRADDAGLLDTDLTAEQAATWLAGLIDGMFARVAADPHFEPTAQAPVLRRIVTQLLQGASR